jgi:hypothetical protein
VSGGRFAGVETIAAINDFLWQAPPYYRNLGEKTVRLVLFKPAPKFFLELVPELGGYAQRKLEKRGARSSSIPALRPSGINPSHSQTVWSSRAPQSSGQPAPPPSREKARRLFLNEPGVIRFLGP